MNSTSHPHLPRRPLTTGAIQLIGVALGVTALAGCARRPIIVQAPPPTVVQTPAPTMQAVTTPVTRDVIVVKEAPPPPRPEPPPPPAPSSSYTWVPGYWSVRDGRHEWVPGRYEAPPRAGATWVAPRWERSGEGYVFIDGYWR